MCVTRAPYAKPFVGLVLQKLLFMGIVLLLNGFAFWWRHLWPTIFKTPSQKDTFWPQNPLSFIPTELFSPVLRSIVQVSESLVACFDDERVNALLSINLPYWVLPAFRKNETFPNFLYIGANGTSYPCSWYVLVGSFCWSLPPPWYCPFLIGVWSYLWPIS